MPISKAEPENVNEESFAFSKEEYNAYSCPWHDNLTAAIVSF